MKKTFLGSGMLLLAAFFWGSTFVAQSSAAERISPFCYLFARSVVGALALFFVILLRLLLQKKKRGLTIKGLFSRRTLLGGVLCGVALTAGSALQQYGIHLGASAGQAGFLTALYMFFVPLFAFLFYKKRPSVSLLAGAVLTAVGLYFLCLKGDGGALFGIGQLLLIGCALVFALHILLVDRYEKSDGMALSCVQFSTCALLSLPVALLFESGSFLHIPEAPFPILYAGICSSAIAYTLQIYGQKYTPPALASVLVSTESVIALLSEWACAALGIFGTAFALSVDQCVGCVLAFLGILCAQSLFSFKKKKKTS